MSAGPEDSASPAILPSSVLEQQTAAVGPPREPKPGSPRRPAGIVSMGAVLTVLSFCSAALSALATLIVAVRVGPSVFGPQAALIGLATLGSLLFDAGLSTVIQRTEAQQPGTAREILGRRYLLCGAILALAVLVSLGIPQAGLALGYAVVLATSLATGAALRGAHRFGLASLLTLLDKGIACVAALAIAAASPDLALVGAFTLGTTLQVLAALLLLRPPVISAWGRRRLLADFAVGRHFFGTALLNESQRLDVPIVNAVSGAAAAGIFAAPARVTALLGTPASVLTGILLTRLSSRRPGAIRDTRIVAAVLVVGHLIAAIVIAVVARPMTNLVLGRQYGASAALLAVYGFAMLPAVINQLSSTVLAAHRREKQTVARVAISIPLSLILVAVGAGLGGALGATAGFAIGQTVLCLLLTPKAIAALRPQKADGQET